MILVRLGLADLWHERLNAACQVLALAAVLAPLLVLAGLRYGVISALLDQLRSDPAKRELRIVGNLSLTPEDVQRIASLPGTAFVVPLTRSIARSVQLQALGGRSSGLQQAELWPTAAGDPLLPPSQPPLTDGDIAISPLLASRLGRGAGAALQVVTVRGVRDGHPVFLRLPLKVASILPEGLLGGPRALVTFRTLELIQAFLDGFALPDQGITEGTPLDRRPNVYEGLRLYARDLIDVAPLSAVLEAPPLSMRVISDAAEITRMLDLDRNLATVFELLVLVAGGGYLVSLAAALWANVMRKRRPLSVIRLLGGSRRVLLAFPLVQALTVATLGSLLALVLFGAGATFVNLRFGAQLGAGRPVCALPPSHLVVAFAATLAAAFAAALLGGWRASAIQPNEGLRDA